MTPKRIQRKRTRGWRMPEGAIYVGRPTKWGNPFRPIGESHEFVVRLYENWLARTPEGQAIAKAAQRELRGRDLVCWCRLDEACHGDTLLRIANE